MSQDTQAGVVMLSSDLMFSSRVKAAATQNGIPFLLAGKLPDDLAPPIRLVIIDLSTFRGDLGDLVRHCGERHPNAKLIAYGPHVQVAKLDAARDAGIETVMTNGQFSSQFPALLE